MSKWGYLTFSDVITDETKNATKIKKDKYLPSGKYQIIDQGQEQVAGYTNDEVGIYTEVPAIIFGDHTRIIKYVDKPLFLGADGVKLLKIKKNCLDYKFLYYYFVKNKVPNTGYNRHFKWLKELSIPVPPLDIQKHIADTLDKTQEIIDGHKKQLEELDNLIKATFYDMFGDPVTNEKNWEVKKMKEISSLITKGSSPNWQGIKYTEDSSQVLFVTSENVRGGYLNLDKPKYLEKKFNDIQKRSVLKYGDLLINIVGASIGRAAVYNLNKQANINQAVALVRCNKDINLIYICQYLNSPKAHIMYGEMQVDVARANLSLENIGDLEIIYPPLDLQNKFAQLVTNIEEQKSLVKQSITESQNLFNSLMSKYFD